MRRSNYDVSTFLVAIGAVAVLISLFLDWYGDPGINAFTAFEITDWLLVALSVGALVVMATEAWSGGGTPSNRLAWICGILAFVVIVQLLDPPPAARGADREIGAWLALAGAALMVVGAVLAMAQISVTIDVSERERRQRMAAVDARADADGPRVDDEDDFGEAPTTASAPAARRSGGSGLWQGPAAPEVPEPDEAPTRTSSRDSGTPAPRSRPKPAAPKAAAAPRKPTPKAASPDARSTSSQPASPADDPDRTQPFKPVDGAPDDASSEQPTGSQVADATSGSPDDQSSGGAGDGAATS